MLEARGLVKTFGHVVGLAGVDLKLHPGEVLAVIGDNGAGKSTLIKCLSGAMIPDAGSITRRRQARSPSSSTQEAREAGIETVYQTLAVAPALDIASNLFLAREIRRQGVLGSVFRMLDTGEHEAAGQASTSTSSASARCRTSTRRWRRSPAASGKRSPWPAPRAFGSRVVILDEPTAALGVRETGQVLKLVRTCATRAWASS